MRIRRLFFSGVAALFWLGLLLSMTQQVDASAPYAGAPISFMHALSDAGGARGTDVVVTDTVLYMPLVSLDSALVPGPPSLDPINNPEQRGNYRVSWDKVDRTNRYLLQEDTDPGFTGPAAVYVPGSELSWSTAGRAAGVYYYRVKALSSWGDTVWSNVEATTVAQVIGVRNGGFEKGAAYWYEYSSHGWDVIIAQGFPADLSPYDGTWAAWLGGDYNDISFVEQQVTVPADATYLVYWQWIASENGCTLDLAGTLVDGHVVDMYSLCARPNAYRWSRRVDGPEDRMPDNPSCSRCGPKRAMGAIAAFLSMIWLCRAGHRLKALRLPQTLRRSSAPAIAPLKAGRLAPAGQNSATRPEEKLLMARP